MTILLKDPASLVSGYPVAPVNSDTALLEELLSQVSQIAETVPAEAIQQMTPEQFSANTIVNLLQGMIAVLRTGTEVTWESKTNREAMAISLENQLQYIKQVRGF